MMEYYTAIEGNKLMLYRPCVNPKVVRLREKQRISKDYVQTNSIYMNLKNKAIIIEKKFIIDRNQGWEKYIKIKQKKWLFMDVTKPLS